MRDDDEIARRYYQDYGAQHYDSAMHALWEDHCKYGRNGKVPSWPPTLEQVKEAVSNEQERRYWENDRR